MRKILGLLGVVLLPTLWFAAPSFQQAQMIRYVSNTSPTCNGQAPCYATIQAAINAAQAGDTIRIQAGTYTEAVLIKGKNAAAGATEADRIVIEADPTAPVESVIVGTTATTCVAGTNLQIESSQFVTIRGLTIAGGKGQALTLAGGAKKKNAAIHIERNRILGNGTCKGGLLISKDNADILIANNLIYGSSQHGVNVQQGVGGPHYFISNAIHGNGKNGILIGKDQEVWLVNNLITNNGTDPKSAATDGFGVKRRVPKAKATPELAVLLHNLVCGNAGGELNGAMLDSSDAGNLTPLGSEGTGVAASPGCNNLATLYANLNGTDAQPNTADDDFTPADDSPAVDSGIDPRTLGASLPASSLEADFLSEAARPQDGGVGLLFDIGAVEKGFLPGTGLTGRVLDTNAFVQNGTELPVVGAKVSLLDTGVVVTSNANGFFTLTGVPSGNQVLDIDTSTANAAPDGSPYAGFREKIRLTDGILNVVARPFYLPRIARESLTTVNPNAITTVRNPTLNITLTVPAHTAKTQAGADFTGQLSISEVPDALAPAALPAEFQPGLLITIQPVGVTFATPVAITFPNTDNLPPGTETDIWSLDPKTGTFVVVGTGRVSADGTRIETINGGVRAADWHFVLPVRALLNGLFNSDNQDQERCSKCPFGSEAAVSNGNLVEAHTLAPYQSLTDMRSVRVVYNSLHADPQPIIATNTTIPVRSAVPRSISSHLNVAGVDQGQELFTSTSGLNESTDETIRQAVQFDASGFETGLYPFRLALTNHFAASSVASVINDQVLVVNEQNSLVGAGWEFDGVARLYPQSDGKMLLTEGDGSALVFRPSVTNFNFSDFADVSSFSRNGTVAAIRHPVFANGRNVLRLTNAGSSQVSTAFLTTPVAWTPDGSLHTTFQFQISGGPGADGLTFLLTRSPALIGPAGGYLGYDGLTSSLAVEFDTWFNGWDSNANHVGIDVNGSVASVVQQLVSPRFDNGAVWHVWIDYDGITDRLEVRVSQTDVRPDTALLAYTVDIPNLLGQTDVFMGFSAATGSAVQTQDILSWQFTFDASPGPSNVFVPPAGDFSTLEANPDGSFTRTFTDGTRINFNADGLQTAVVDRNGNTTSYEYDGNGRLTSITDPTGLVTALSYNGGLLSSITDPAGRITSFQHDAAGNLTRITDPDGSSRQFEYDARHRLTAQTSPKGFRSTYAYNFAGRVVRTDRPDASTRQVTPSEIVGLIDPASGFGTSNNPAPFVRPSATVAEVTDGEGRKTDFVTDRFGSATRVTDVATGLATQITRNSQGDPTAITLPSAHTQSYTYDAKGNPLSVTDSILAGTTNLTYDPVFNLVTSITEALGQKTTIARDAKGNATQVTSHLGRTVHQAYDSRGLPTLFTDALGTSTAFTYDAKGNVTQAVQGSGADQRVATFAYTPEGYLATLTDPENRVVSFTYDPLGRIESQTLPDGRVIIYSYDANGNLTALTPPGRPAHSFTYTKVDRMEDYIPPDVGAGTNKTVYTYNKDQQLTQVTRPDGKTIQLDYDTAGRVQAQTIERGQYVYAYNATTGNLQSISTPGSGTATYAYSGSLLTGTTWAGTIAGNVAWTYDKNFRLATIKVNNANTVTYQYDNDSLLTGVGSLTLSRNAQNGLLTGSTLGNVTDTLTYNAFGEPDTYTAKYSGADIYKNIYTRDKLGRITTKTETIGGSTITFTYDYDPAGRLKEVKQDGMTTATYTYDDNGNRLTGPSVTTASYDSQDRLLTYGGNTYSYTPNGELLTKTNTNTSTAYTYDELGNLLKVILPNGDQIDYLIDGQNRRIGKKVNGTLVQGFLYQDQLKPIAELNGSGAIVSRFVFGTHVNVPDYMIKGGVTYRIITDHLGSVRLVVRVSDGAVVQRRDYDEFGNVVFEVEDPSLPNLHPFGFAGGLYDQHTKLVRFGARDYDAATGRWTAKDPIGFAGGDVNLYGYVIYDSINFIDPNGFCPCGNPADVINAARSDTRDWGILVDRSDVNSGFSSGTFKCNLFVDTQYEQAGYNLPNIGGSAFSRAFGRYPPGAQSLSDSNYSVPGWPVVTGPAQAGDLMALGGHVGIATGAGTSISAKPSGTVENDWGFRPGQTPVIRRCTCQ